MKHAATIQMLSPGGGKIFRKDRLAKFIGIPLVAVAAVNVTGFIHNQNYTAGSLLFSYAYFIICAWIIWEGNVQFMILLKKKQKVSYHSYYRSILTLYAIVIIYTACIAAASLYAWMYFSEQNKVSQQQFFITVIVIVVSSVFIANLYEIFYLTSEQADTVKRAEQLNISKTHAELIALKNHIDPHFIFNSLNTLSYLISKDPVNAKHYNDTLAKVYHYILFNRDKNFVLVRDEIEFVTNFFYLLKIRFDKTIDMAIEIINLSAEEFFIPAISLQILLENAIKHNELNIKDPLKIYITVTSNFIVVKNRIIQKKYATATTGSGLINLDNRYKLLTGKTIIVYKNEEYFIVKLPVLNSEYENINC